MRESLQPLGHSALKIELKLVHFSPNLTKTIFLRAFFRCALCLPIMLLIGKNVQKDVRL